METNEVDGKKMAARRLSWVKSIHGWVDEKALRGPYHLLMCSSSPNDGTLHRCITPDSRLQTHCRLFPESKPFVVARHSRWLTGSKVR